MSLRRSLPFALLVFLPFPVSASTFAFSGDGKIALSLLFAVALLLAFNIVLVRARSRRVRSFSYMQTALFMLNENLTIYRIIRKRGRIADFLCVYRSFPVDTLNAGFTIREGDLLSKVYGVDILHYCSLCEKVIADGGVHSFEKLHEKTGSFIRVSLFSVDKIHVGILAADVSEQVMREKSVLHQKNFIEKIASTTSSGILSYLRDGRIQFANARAEEILGCRGDIMMSEIKAFARLNDDGSEGPECSFPDLPMVRVLTDGRALLGERMVIFMTDGRRIPVRISVDVLDRKDGRPESVIVTFDDISSELAAEEKRYSVEMLLRTTVENAPVAVQIASFRDGVVHLDIVNKAAVELLGVSAEEQERITSADPSNIRWNLFHHSGAPYELGDFPLVRAIYKGESVSNVLLRVVRPDGKERWIISNAEPLRNKQGEIVSGVVVSYDISDFVTTMNQLKESEKRYRIVAENMVDIVWQMDLREKRFTLLSPSVKKVTGYSPEEIYGRPLSDFIGESSVRLIGENIESLVSDRAAPRGVRKPFLCDMDFLCADGRSVTLEFSVALLSGENGGRDIAVGVARDVTEKRSIERAFAKTDMRLRAIMDAIPDIVLFGGKDGVISEMNDYSLKLKSSGVDVHRILSLSPECGLDGTSSSRFEYELDFSGGKMVFDVMKVFLSDESNEGALVVGRDITARKRMEEEIKASLREKDVLFQEVHHRVKNNLQVIISLLNLQSRKMENSVLSKVLSDCTNRIRSMALVHEKLYMSEDFSGVDFGDYIRELARIMSAASDSAGGVNFMFNTVPVRIHLNQAVVCALISNEIISNAFKHAFPEGWDGPKNIEITVKAEGPAVVLEFTDGGAGFSEGHSGVSDNTLGTSLIRLLSQQLGGELKFSSKPGETRYSLKFPLEG